MAKRKQFKNIANGILTSFISRNNDVCGYWGIGKLYALMVKSECFSIEIDLINKTISPKDEEFSYRVSEYSKYLFKRMLIHKIQDDFLKESKIQIIGSPNEPILSLGKTAPHKMICKIVIIDNLNKEYKLEKNVWCRKHNPKSEFKRG